MEREVLFVVFISFFVLIGLASLAVQLKWIGSDPSFRKWSRVSFLGSVTVTMVSLFKIVFMPSSVPVATSPAATSPAVATYSVSLVFPTERVLPSLKNGTYEFDDVEAGQVKSHTGSLVTTLLPGGWTVKLPSDLADKSVRLKVADLSGKTWQVKDPFYPNYISQNVESAIPVVSRAVEPHSSFGVAVLLAAQSGREPATQSHASVKFNNWARPLVIQPGQQSFEWRVFVDEPAAVLNTIRQVDYVLHPTFPDPFRTSQDRSKDFELVSSGWGTFTLLITIHYTNGSSAKTSYELSFNKAWPATVVSTKPLQPVATSVEPLRDAGKQVKVGRFQPVGLAMIGSEQLAVLSKSGEIDVVAGGRREFFKQIQSFVVTDLAGAPLSNGKYVVLVSSFLQSTPGQTIGGIDLLPAGQAVRTPGSMYYGIAVGSASPLIAFVTKGREREVRRVESVGTRLTTKLLAVVPDPGAILGPIALDPAGKMLYAVDISAGNVWAVPVLGGSPRLFATGLEDPRAIAVDGGSVFVAEGSRRRIIQLSRAGSLPSNGPQTPAMAQVIALAEFQSPSAIAVADAGQLWVGDSDAGAAFLLSVKDKKILRIIR